MRRRSLNVFPIGSNVKSCSPLVAILDLTQTCRTQFWKGVIQEPLWPRTMWPSLIPVDQVVSEEKIFECASPVPNVKLSSLLVHILDPARSRRTLSLKGIIQEPLWPNLFPIDRVVSEKKIFDSVSPKGSMSTLRTCWVGPRPAGRNFERGPSKDRCD